jgi:hypothetical protein
MRNHTQLLFVLCILTIRMPVFSQNDKQVLGDAVFSPTEVTDGAEVIFLIRFQNIFLDTAFNIVVRDTLDPRFDASTFTMLDASHNYQLLQEDGQLRWFFSDIKLPSAENQPPGFANSTGFVLYSVQLQRFLTAGQTILNRACINFDDQAFLCTNDAAVWIDQGAVAPEPGAAAGLQQFTIVPNPNYGQFEVRSMLPTNNTDDRDVEWWISDMNGKTIWDGSSQDMAMTPNQVMLERPSPGLYMLWMKENGALQVEQFAVIR